MNTFIKNFKTILYGINIKIKAPIVIKGPNGMYSSDFFLFKSTKTILTNAPIKNARIVIINVFAIPKYSPIAPHILQVT